MKFATSLSLLIAIVQAGCGSTPAPVAVENTNAGDELRNVSVSGVNFGNLSSSQKSEYKEIPTGEVEIVYGVFPTGSDAGQQLGAKINIDNCRQTARFIADRTWQVTCD